MEKIRQIIKLLTIKNYPIEKKAFKPNPALKFIQIEFIFLMKDLIDKKMSGKEITYEEIINLIKSKSIRNGMKESIIITFSDYIAKIEELFKEFFDSFNFLNENEKEQQYNYFKDEYEDFLKKNMLDINENMACLELSNYNQIIKNFFIFVFGFTFSIILGLLSIIFTKNVEISKIFQIYSPLGICLLIFYTLNGMNLNIFNEKFFLLKNRISSGEPFKKIKNGILFSHIVMVLSIYLTMGIYIYLFPEIYSGILFLLILSIGLIDWIYHQRKLKISFIPEDELLKARYYNKKARYSLYIWFYINTFIIVSLKGLIENSRFSVIAFIIPLLPLLFNLDFLKGNLKEYEYNKNSLPNYFESDILSQNDQLSVYINKLMELFVNIEEIETLSKKNKFPKFYLIFFYLFLVLTLTEINNKISLLIRIIINIIILIISIVYFMKFKKSWLKEYKKRLIFIIIFIIIFNAYFIYLIISDIISFIQF